MRIQLDSPGLQASTAGARVPESDPLHRASAPSQTSALASAGKSRDQALDNVQCLTSSLSVSTLCTRSTSTTEPFSSLCIQSPSATHPHNNLLASSARAQDWADLPDDTLKYIFSQLQPASLRGIRLVCSAWHRTVSRFIVSLQPESFRGKHLGWRFPYLQVLDLRHADTCITHEGTCLSMQSSLDDTDLAQLAHLPQGLQSLQLGNSPYIHGSGLQHLPVGLRELNLTGCCSLRDEGLLHLAALTGLTLLSLASCPRLTDTGLSHLGCLSTLRALILSSNSLITDFGLVLLTQVTGLRSLELHGLKGVSQKGFAELSLHPHLDVTISLCNVPAKKADPGSILSGIKWMRPYRMIKPPPPVRLDIKVLEHVV
ncbi:hypothetical protein WJX74_009765 [Apatococcus lobatus]|uniref:F-box domain-containing protein n=2 Tax=Apatococcus TaxID=904362 RepID=A0AAW1SR42_9CHLO